MITVVGSLNTDLFIETNRLPRPGETVSGQNFRISAGGKGANQAVALARMGAQVAMLGAVGDDSFGRDLLDQLGHSGVLTKSILRRGRTPTGAAMIVVDAAGQNQIVIAPGANGTLAPEDILREAALIEQSAALVAQLETPLATVECALRLARKAGVTTVLNPAPACQLTDGFLGLCDWIIPNELEAATLTRSRVDTCEDAAAAAQQLRRQSGAQGVAITLGAQGAWVEHDSYAGHLPALPVPVVDTVGAGDTFIGAFVARLVQGDGPRAAALFASAAAALAVTRRGAQAGIPTLAEVEAFLREETA